METPVIRRARIQDIPTLDKLLFEVHKVHSDARPDLFKAGAKKYTDEELAAIIPDDKRPIFVAEVGGEVVGYAFCIHKQFVNDNNMTDVRTLYIDDLCVDENVRGLHIGRSLYDYVIDYARGHGCHDVTLNVWSCNPGAKAFYEAMGMTPYKVGMEQVL